MEKSVEEKKILMKSDKINGYFTRRHTHTHTHIYTYKINGYFT